MLYWYHPCLLVDPHGNANNQDSVLIDLALYRANSKFLKLEEEIAAKYAERTPYKPMTM